MNREIELKATIALAVVLSASVCGTAFCREEAPTTLRDSLRQQGMTEVSDGLYVNEKNDSQSYVAVGAAGQQALLEKLNASRANDEERGPLTPYEAERQNAIDDLMAKLNPIGVDSDGGGRGPYLGDCTGVTTNGPFRVQALVGGSIANGDAGASAGVFNVGTTINTKNYTYATAEDRLGNIIATRTATTYGTTPSASHVYGRACVGYSAATITCPGTTIPAITATQDGHINGCVPR